MSNLAVKEIKGNTYLYIKDSVKVNSKSLPVLVYVGRFEKATPDLVLSKLGNSGI